MEKVKRSIYIFLKRILDLYPKFVGGESIANWIGKGLRKILIAANLYQPLPEDYETKEQAAAIVIVSSFPFSRWKKAFPNIFEEIPDQEDLLKHLGRFRQKDYVLFYKFIEKRAKIGDYLPLITQNASIQLLRLAEEEMLPVFCPLHEKVFWSRCPLCSEPKELSSEEASVEASSERSFRENTLQVEDVPDRELYRDLLEEMEEQAQTLKIKLEMKKKLDIHRELLESREKDSDIGNRSPSRS